MATGRNIHDERGRFTVTERLCDEFLHTPNPWEVRLEDDDPAAPFYDVVSTLISDRETPVAGLIPNKYDARLIAVAPDLLMLVCDAYWKKRSGRY
tara:strand:- start:42 stop:326 length:285 start_codon:yes stop_codon:yes gene_type:complete